MQWKVPQGREDLDQVCLSLGGPRADCEDPQHPAAVDTVDIPDGCPSRDHTPFFPPATPHGSNLVKALHIFTDFMPIWLYYYIKLTTSWSRHIRGHSTIYPDAKN